MIYPSLRRLRTTGSVATSYRAAGWEEVGKTRGFSRARHARDFYIPNGRPKVLYMKPFRKDAWELAGANSLPPEYEAAARLGGDASPHLAADGKFVGKVPFLGPPGWQGKGFSAKRQAGNGKKPSAK